ncbi:hypothetical protein PLICRDRAFT_96436 [Plicaturopsis crispa FD-325 SS-3]|nr:hypothetical protein PLICRDRAFT_96436 [Plicaturopsis crispa FD-325 SS-3]
MSDLRRSRFAPYKAALQAISTRTGSPLSSLVLSFAVLHEITALVPLVGVFYGARALGVGERLVAMVSQEERDDWKRETGWAREKFRTWIDEGERWAGRVGRRYGVFGFEKGQIETDEDRHRVSANIAGDLANAVVAYAAGKALLPVRVGLSLYLSPLFSRRIVEPIRINVMRPFRRRL